MGNGIPWWACSLVACASLCAPVVATPEAKARVGTSAQERLRNSTVQLPAFSSRSRQARTAPLTLTALPQAEAVAPPPQFELPDFFSLAIQPPAPLGGGGGGAGSGSGSAGSGSGSGTGHGQDENPPFAQDPRKLRPPSGDGRGEQREIQPGGLSDEFPDSFGGEAITPEGRFTPDGFAPASRLIPAMTNNNPAWSYRVALPGGVYSGCQATLISKEEGVCRAATAAHCLHDALKAYGGRVNPEFGMYEGRANITTADFGNIEAKIFLHTSYVNSTGAKHDSGLIAWSCNPDEVSVPVIPITDDTSPLNNAQTVYYGKVMGGKEGLYRGQTIVQSGVRINGIPDGEARLEIDQSPAVNGSTNPDGRRRSIQQGDSGGPILSGSSPEDFKLVGVLSTSDDITKNRPRGNYAAGIALAPLIRASRKPSSAFGFKKPEASELASK